MARVTVEKALDKVNNKFELVILASYRAHAIACGRVGFFANTSEKPTVTALRELELDKIDVNLLRSAVMEKHSVEQNSPSAIINSLSSSDFTFEDLFNDGNADSEKEEKMSSGKVKLGDIEVDVGFFE
ncbi:MAG: DNA-directed polymerase omega subunit [Pseudomonadota bacterium]|jgi:DNA-directed RNA polymerase subunit omega